MCLLDSVITWLYNDVNRNSGKKKVMKMELLGGTIPFENSKQIGGHDITGKHISFVKWKLSIKSML